MTKRNIVYISLGLMFGLGLISLLCINCLNQYEQDSKDEMVVEVNEEVNEEDNIYNVAVTTSSSVIVSTSSSSLKDETAAELGLPGAVTTSKTTSAPVVTSTPVNSQNTTTTSKVTTTTPSGPLGGDTNTTPKTTTQSGPTIVTDPIVTTSTNSSGNSLRDQYLAGSEDFVDGNHGGYSDAGSESGGAIVGH